MINTIVTIALIVAGFIAGLRLDNYYQNKANKEQKEALEKQFVRLRARVDADDPCRPYGNVQWIYPKAHPLNTGDYDGDIIGQNFMEHLKNNGKATVKVNKADIRK